MCLLSKYYFNKFYYSIYLFIYKYFYLKIHILLLQQKMSAVGVMYSIYLSLQFSEFLGLILF